MINHLGNYSVGGMFPTFIGALAGMISQLRGQLTGALRVSGTLQIDLPSLDARIKAVNQIAAQLAISPPGVRFNGAANVSLIATIQAQLQILLELQTALGVGGGGIAAYEYEGPASSFGTEVASVTNSGIQGGAPSDQMFALVLATRYSAAFDALRTVILP